MTIEKDTQLYPISSVRDYLAAHATEQDIAKYRFYCQKEMELYKEVEKKLNTLMPMRC